MSLSVIFFVLRLYRAVEELNSKNWQATRGAYLGMIAVMARHQDWPGVLDVSSEYKGRFDRMLLFE